MKWILSLLIFVIVSCLLVAPPVEAGSGLYLSSELGVNFASGMNHFGRDDDRASKCDEYINPFFAMVPGCTDPDRGGDASKAVYDRAHGHLGRGSRGLSTERHVPGSPSGVGSGSSWNISSENRNMINLLRVPLRGHRPSPSVREKRHCRRNVLGASPPTTCSETCFTI